MPPFAFRFCWCCIVSAVVSAVIVVYYVQFCVSCRLCAGDVSLFIMLSIFLHHRFTGDIKWCFVFLVLCFALLLFDLLLPCLSGVCFFDVLICSFAGTSLLLVLCLAFLVLCFSFC